MAQQIASLYADIGAKTDGFKKGAASVKSGLKDIGNDADIAEKKMAILGSVVSITTGLIVNSYSEYSKLSEAIRDLSLVSGANAEQTSKFIQVLDDFQITADDATAAAKKLKENGLSPTIETIAALSDQFKSIKDPAERMEFVYEKLGKSGAKWVNMLNQGGDALLKNADAINKNLILNDMQIKMYEIGRLAIDEQVDAFTAFRVELGKNTGNVLAYAAAMKRAKEIQSESVVVARGGMTRSTIEYADALNQAIAEQLAAADSSLALTDSIKEQEAAMKAASSANQEFLSVMGNIQASEEDFADRNKSLIEKRIELEGKRAQEIAKGWAMDAEKVKEYDQALAENDEAIRENAREHELANRKIVLGLLERKLMQDGILDDKELLWLLEKGKAWGIYSDTIIAETRAAIDEANRLIAGLVTEKTFTLNVQTSGGNTTNTQHVRTGSGRASGGNVTMGQAYVVGERGAEMFIPATNGRIVPNGAMQGGGSAEIVAAIQNSRLNEEKLARLFENALLRVAK